MKLRIKGDSMRLRVSRSELARLQHGERVEETIHFSAAPESQLTYGLQSAPQSAAVRVEWKPQSVTVLISEEQMKIWSAAPKIGIYESIDIGRLRPLELIVEKDFACLDRSDADNADTFANPKAEAACAK